MKDKTIVNQQKLDRAFRYGYEVGHSRQPHQNKCKYSNFQLRERWFQGYRQALNEIRKSF